MPRGGARAGAGKHPIFDESLTRVNVSLDPETISFYKRHGSSLSDGIRQYWRGLTKREPDSLKAGVLSLPAVVKSESNLPA